MTKRYPELLRILVLGGTGDARALATALARRAEFSTILSLAGRTAEPAIQPVPTRRGGFGGADGLARYLMAEKIDVLIDATHPFARIISANAVVAATQADIPLIVLQRRPWLRRAEDRWTVVGTMQDAALALGSVPKNVFLAIGRNEVSAFEGAPQHFYLSRSVDPLDPVPALPHLTQILSRGPFVEQDELDLLTRKKIDIVVSKNSGGTATLAKIEAARRLYLPVIMVARPADPPGWAALDVAENVEGVLARLDHVSRTLVPRGV